VRASGPAIGHGASRRTGATRFFDRLFRQTFADAEHAAALLSACLPPHLATTFDWSTLAVRTAEFVDEHLREHRTDEVFAVRGSDGAEYIVQLEHKATDDHDAPRQSLRYQLQISDHYRGLGLPVPPILPVLVHHGGRPWSAPTSLLEGRGGGLHPFTDVRMIVIDFASYSEAVILALPLTDRGKAAVLLLQILRDATPVVAWAMLQRWLPLLRAVRWGRDGRRALAGLMTYALEVTELSRDQLLAYAEMVGDQTDKDTIMSTADKLRAEGRIETLLRQLTRRFGPLPDRVADRIRAGTPQELDDWTDRILTAATLEAVFAPD
jgi:hypothetical protein